VIGPVSDEDGVFVVHIETVRERELVSCIASTVASSNDDTVLVPSGIGENFWAWKSCYNERKFSV